MAERDIYVQRCSFSDANETGLCPDSHCAFFFSEDFGILLGCPCGSGTNQGVLANIFSFLQALSLDPLQVVMELKLEEPC